MSGVHWLRVAALVETTSLLVLVVNLATVHADYVTSAVGPLHGFAWLATISTALLLPLSRAARLWAVVPGIGGLLALHRTARDRSRQPSAGPSEQDRADRPVRP
jgi:hypothetical protein